MGKSLQAAAINFLIGVSVFINILSMGCCTEDGSNIPLSDQPLSPLNQPLNPQPYTPLTGQASVNQLPLNSQIGQQFPLVNQPLINQPGLVNQPFSPFNAQPGLSQPLLNGQSSLAQALNQPFVNSFPFSGSDNQRLSVQVVMMASCLVMFVLSFIFMW